MENMEKLKIYMNEDVNLIMEKILNLYGKNFNLHKQGCKFNERKNWENLHGKKFGWVNV